MDGRIIIALQHYLAADNQSAATSETAKCCCSRVWLMYVGAMRHSNLASVQSITFRPTHSGVICKEAVAFCARRQFWISFVLFRQLISSLPVTML